MDEQKQAYVYVLRSRRNKKRYVGYTEAAPEERLKQHNSGSNTWTRQNGPFDLIYKESFFDSKEARRRERFLKSGVGRKILDDLLKNEGAQFQPEADPPPAGVRALP